MEATSMLTSVFECVLKSSWQAAVLVCLVLAVQRVFARSISARWRYSLWLLVVLRLLIPVAPESVFSIYNLAPQQPNDLRAARRVPLDLPLAQIDRSADARSPITSPADSSRGAAARPPAPTRPISALLWLIGAWLSGTGVFAASVVWQIVRFARRVRRYPCLNDDEVHEVLSEAKRMVGTNAVVRVVETSETPVPAMFGMIRPRLLLPQNFRTNLSVQELRLVFLHELTHLKRRDHVLNWLMLAVTAVHWFNPIVWLAFSRMRADRELACDEQVLSVSPDHQNKDYGRMLIKLLEGLPRPARLPGLIGIVENTNQLKRRITMIAKFKRPARWSVLLALPLIVLGFITLTDAQTKKERADKNIIAEVEKFRGKVKFDETKPDRPIISVSFSDESFRLPEEKRATDAVLALLGTLQNLEELDLTSTEITDEGLAHLKGLPKLRKLNLRFAKISGAGLRHLETVSKLSELDLQGSAIDDAGLANLQYLPNLEILRFGRSSKITGPGLKHLAGLKKLRAVHFGPAKIAEAVFINLGELRNLEELVLSGVPNAPFGDEALAHLKGLSKLTHLDLGRFTRVTEAGFETLKNFPNLRVLAIWNSQINAAGLVQLKQFPKLEELRLEGPDQVTDAAMEHLRALPKLKRVVLASGANRYGGEGKLSGEGKITEAGLKILADLHLEVLGQLSRSRYPLHLTGPTITDSSLVHLKQLKRLEGLRLHDTRVTDSGLAHLKDITGLISLDLVGSQFTDAAVIQIKQLSNLSHLMLDGTQLSDTGLKILTEMSKLEELSLQGSRVTDAGLANLKALPSLSYLDLSQTSITDAGMAHLSSLPRLEYLLLGGTRVTSKGLQRLQDLPNLGFLVLDHTQINDDDLGEIKNFRGLGLWYLSVRKTKVTTAGIEALKKDLPKLGFNH